MRIIFTILVCFLAISLIETKQKRKREERVLIEAKKESKIDAYKEEHFNEIKYPQGDDYLDQPLNVKGCWDRFYNKGDKSGQMNVYCVREEGKTEWILPEWTKDFKTYKAMLEKDFGGYFGFYEDSDYEYQLLFPKDPVDRDCWQEMPKKKGNLHRIVCGKNRPGHPYEL